MVCRWAWFLFFSFFLASSSVIAYEVPISHTDYDRQTCSGMWAGENTYINVTFDATSQGELASVIYEWEDVKYLGKNTSRDGDLPLKTYICTSDAIKAGLCDINQEGRFITDLPKGKHINDTSFWIARVSFSQTDSSDGSEVSVGGFWDNPAGNQKTRQSGAPLNPSPTGILVYTSPIQYLVRKTGYYCVGVVPLLDMPVGVTRRQVSANSTHHSMYSGMALFRNAFDGKLPASDYPKINFYLSMFFVSSALAITWGWLCYQNAQDLLPIQYYLSGFLAFFFIEMLANWVYYCYFNAHGERMPSTVFLIVFAVFDAGRNALSLFLLLILSLGLSVTKESLGSLMIRCQLLAGAHFILGSLYAAGIIIELEPQPQYAFILLVLAIPFPLALALSGFLLGWIIYSLNATISQLAAGKQHYKLSMFVWLRRIVLVTVVVVAIFFIMWYMRFPARLAEDYGPKTWRSRWWLLDGWRAVLCLVDFAAIAYLWRPSPNHR